MTYLKTISSLICLLISCLAFPACEQASERSDGAGSDADSDTDGDSDGDTDGDSDGDSDGDVDTENNYCDCPGVGNSSAQELAMAANFCVNETTVSTSLYSTSPSPQAGRDTIESMGTNSCLVKRHGCEMFALSTGPVGEPDPNSVTGTEFGSDGMAYIENDPLPAYQGYEPTTSDPYISCDVNQLHLTLLAPASAEGFSFDFLFASAEYPEWVNMGYNDAFYAIMEYSELNGGAPTNISFDDNNNEIEVDVNFFENPAHPCDETGSGWEPAMPSGSGSTGWLRTSWPVSGGASFSLTFSIHDEGDCVWDSIVFIDNFQWLGDPVEGGTVPIE
jgi:hypothetical protein